jgi:hypothetical protein
MPSAAQALYGKDGPISDGPNGDRARAVIDSGIARPSENSIFGSDQQPGARPPPASDQSRPSPTSPTPAAPFNPERYAAPEGGHLHPELMSEFAKEARSLGIGHQGGERLLDLHHKAVREQEEHYARSLDANVERLQRELPAEDVQMVNRLIADPQMTPPSMKAHIERWGNHEDFARMLTAWARAIREGY